MLFHLFCEFADGSAKYLHLHCSNVTEAHREAIRLHSASVVLFVIDSLDPACRLLELDCCYSRQKFVVSEKLQQLLPE